jgi:hypothetical protein
MQEVMDGLEPVLDLLNAIPRDAVAKYQEYPAAMRIDHTGRTAANCVYAHMEAGAVRLEEVPGIVHRDVRGLKVWLYKDLAVLRFKRMDEEGRFRRYPTTQAKDYDRNAPIPGLPLPAVRLAVGYVLDPTATSVLRVQVARPSGREIDWCAAIVPAEDRAAGDPSWVDVTRQRRFG